MKPDSKKDYLTFILVVILVILFGAFGVYNHQCYLRYQKHLQVERLIHKRHLRHIKRWRPVKQAQENPTAKNLAKLSILKPYKNSVLVLEHNKTPLRFKTWRHNHIDFSHMDKYGRLSYPATAYLSKNNVIGDALRKPQKVKPVGWHQHKYDGTYLLNRGHLIAYSLTKNINFKGQHVVKPVGNQNDPDNLFTETEFCNQQLQYTFETRIRIALERGKHIIYRVQPIFKSKDLMPRGVHLQAVSTDGKFHINVYLFNVQPGVIFNYRTGKATPDGYFQFKLPKEMIKNSESMDDHDKHMRYQRQVMHLYDNHLISRQQAILDEEQSLNGYSIKY